MSVLQDNQYGSSFRKFYTKKIIELRENREEGVVRKAQYLN